METNDLITFDDSNENSPLKVPAASKNIELSSVFNANIDSNTSLTSLFNDNLLMNIEGRESLGILNANILNDENFINDTNTPTIKILNQNGFHQFDDLNCSFDMKFNSDSKFSFNSESISKIETCKIFSITSDNNVLNNGFLQFTRPPDILSTSAYPKKYIDCDIPRPRIRSMPDDFFKSKSILQPIREEISEIFNFVNCGNKLKETSNNEEKDFLLIEARHLADKLADGSIFDDSGEVGDELQKTAEPILFKEIEETSPEKEIKTNDVFKVVDKMLPPLNKFKNEEEHCNNTVKSSNDTCISNCTSVSELCQVFCQKLSNSAASENSLSKSKDLKQIIQNLSGILSTSNKTPEQLKEGHNLIASLIQILHNGDASNQIKDTTKKSEDSGHSSDGVAEYSNILPQPESNFSDKSDKDNIKPLDLSLKSNSDKNVVKDKAEPILASTNTSNVLVRNENSFKNMFNNVNKSLKLKSKIISDTKNTTKKGPLKATAPIVNYLKNKDDNVKPIEAKKTVPVRKTSTPYKIKMKPVAQSTPENDKVKQNSIENNDKMNYSNSPLSARSTTNNSGGTNVADNLINNPTKSMLYRRGSTSDLKQEKVNKPIKRSNSIGQDSNIATAAAKAREMVSKKISSYQQSNLSKKSSYSSIKEAEVVKSGLSENKRSILRSKLKPFNLISKLRSGKENTAP